MTRKKSETRTIHMHKVIFMSFSDRPHKQREDRFSIKFKFLNSNMKFGKLLN